MSQPKDKIEFKMLDYKRVGQEEEQQGHGVLCVRKAIL